MIMDDALDDADDADDACRSYLKSLVKWGYLQITYFDGIVHEKYHP